MNAKMKLIDSEGACRAYAGPNHPTELAPGEQRLYGPYLHLWSGPLKTHIAWSFDPTILKLYLRSPCCGRGLGLNAPGLRCNGCHEVYPRGASNRFVGVEDGVIDPNFLRVAERWFENLGGYHPLNASLAALDLRTLLQRQVDLLVRHG